MTRTQLEHILRASAAITGADEFVVIGSQAILGQHPAAPAELLVSHEADVYSKRSPADSDLIEGSIGEGSPFHKTFGYCAHGVGAETAILPAGWEARAIRLKTPATGGATGICPEANDLAVSKLVAGREKDAAYVASLLRHRLAELATLRSRLADTPLPDADRNRVLARLDRIVVAR